MTSNSDRNVLLVELAQRLKEMGVGIIALTALDASKIARVDTRVDFVCV
ncbi:hypothetical protein [Candidatus Enterococcus moelleringii]|nr:hypothetical protein [Enterococcus sp. 669A]